MSQEFKVGEKIISALDGQEYTIVRFGPRDELEPLPGVKQIGNAAIVEDNSGGRHILYEWEMEKV